MSNSLRDRWRYLPRLLRLLWDLGPGDIRLIVALSLAGGLLPILDIELLRRLVDSAVAVIGGTQPFRAAMIWLAVLLSAILIEAVFGAVSLSQGTVIRERLKARAQERLLRKAGRLPLAALERPAFYDELQRAQQGVDARMLDTLELLTSVPSHLVTVIGLLLYVGSAHMLFPIILLAGLIPSQIAGLRLSRQRYELSRKQTAPDRMLRYLGGLMTGRTAAAELRLFGLQRHIFERHRQLFRQMRDERLKLAGAVVRAITLPAVGEQLTYAVVIASLVVLIARGQMSVGHFVAYMSVAERFRFALMMLFGAARDIDADLRYIRDLLDYLAIEEEQARKGVEDSMPAEPSTQNGRPQGQPRIEDGGWRMEDSDRPSSPLHAITICFETVSFVYPGTDRPVLDRLTLTLRPRERVALVGANGAGKTTLAKLLLGLYQPTAGRVMLNGVDLRELDLRWWRRRAAAVFQDYVKYELRVRENIGFGDLDRIDDDAALSIAAARSGADQLIADLPSGYDTFLGKIYDNHGHDLSVGQWQKLAIARAYLRDAVVLVLDEPTAALDARGEVAVYQQFRDMAQGKTTLLISHRLGSARLAERIVFLERGQIVEEGHHDDLVAQGGRYAEMYRVQAGWYS